MEVRPGEGGDDATNFAEHLINALVSHSRRQGWSVTQRVSLSESRTVIAEVSGKDCLVQLRAFAGTHRVQRVPANDKRGRKHTSTATVAVLTAAEAVRTAVLDKDLRVDRMRGTGKGGQNRNKVESAVRVTHVPTGIVVTRLSGRSQVANLEDAKQEIQARLDALAAGKAATAQQNVRATYTDTERSGKRFTHCWYRDQITDHETGRTWTVRQWQQGRLS